MLNCSAFSFAQNGIIRGTVYDGATGETLIGVTVVVEGTGAGTITDIDGKFEIQLQPGNYNLKVSYVSYASLNIENAKVEEGKVTVLDNIRLNESIEQLAEIVVTAHAIRTTEEALLTTKMKSANLMDGISSTSFRKIGDSDAASAVRRVSGVSVEEGKYVFVRGLGDRYTKSTLNGVDIPGLDPDRNTVQMDMFPTNLIDNIIVLKSFTPDLPGDFTGGVVNIDIKDFPEERVFNVSMNAGYNPAMHFNSRYVTSQKGSTDFLGFDDGTRSIPTEKNEDIPRYADVIGRPDSEQGIQYRNLLQKFNPVMAAIRDKSAMDHGFGINIGNQIGRNNNTIGYNFSLVYRNSTEYYEGAEYGRYGKGNASEYELAAREQQVGDFGSNNVILSGLAGIALKREHAKYRINFLHSQNGESRAGLFQYTNSDLGANFEADQTNVEYSERTLTNVLLGGTHFSRDARWHIDWKISPTASRITDPDIRFTRYRTDGGSLSIGSEVGFPERIWRFLEEDNLAGKTDVTRDYLLFNKSAKLKFGSSYNYKQRNYSIQSFQIIPQGVQLAGDPNEVFAPENLWPSNAAGTRGTRYEPSFLPNNTNKYDANAENIAAYISNEFSITPALKTIIGVRVENYVQHYTGLNQQRVSLNNVKVLDDLDFFPSVNLIHSLTDNQNLRLSYSKTVARPSFKESSYAEIYDPLTGRTFIGGFFEDKDPVTGDIIWDGKLSATRIDNFDIRWEFFQKRAQTVSLSGFYKTFDRPIEMVQYVTAPNNFQPRNVGNGEAIGVELELRQSLGFLSAIAENIFLNGNVTVTESEIAMSPTEYNSRVTKAREGEAIENKRQMAGQAPYIINAGLSYNGLNNGLEAGLYYNVQGETLQFVGVADRPDVYTVPFHSMNFNANKTFGADQRLRVGVGISNILDAERKSVFKSFRAQDQIFSRLKPGTRFSLSLSYNL